MTTPLLTIASDLAPDETLRAYRRRIDRPRRSLWARLVHRS